MPFGEELTTNIGGRSEPLKYGASTDNIRQKFTGYQKDEETSLDFAEARMYENRHGRFTAVDPLLASGKSANPQTFNRYVYVLNNPLIHTDPTGLQVGSKDLRECKEGEQCNKVGTLNKETNTAQFNNNTIATVHIQGSSFENLIKSNPIISIAITPREPESLDNVQRLIRGFPESPFSDAGSGFLKGPPNFFIDSWNLATTLALIGSRGPAGIVDATIGYDNPFAIQRFGCSSRIECNWSTGSEMAVPVGAGIVGGVIRGGASALSVVPRSNAFSSSTQSVTSMSKFDLEFTNRVTGGGLRKNAVDIFYNGVKEPVKFVKIDGTNFIVDGNHRTALTFIFRRSTVPAQEVSLPFGQFRTSADVINSSVPRTEILNSSAVRYFRLPSQ